MSDSRTIAGENLDKVGLYSPDIHDRIHKAAVREALDFSDKGVRRAMINIMVRVGAISPMPAHASKKAGKGFKLNAATTLYLKTLSENLANQNI